MWKTGLDCARDGHMLRSSSHILARRLLVQRGLSSGGAANAALEHARLREELEACRQRIRALEKSHPELNKASDALQSQMRSLTDANPELRSQHNEMDEFSPPKLHHINIVNHDSTTLLKFYRDVMKMDEMPIEMFPRNAQTSAGAGSDVPITFTTDGHMQMHLATQDLGVAFRSGEIINPIGVGPVGHIAYRTDDIDAFKQHLDAHRVPYSDYGSRFAKDWHQIFFLDPAGTIVEVHAVIAHD